MYKFYAYINRLKFINRWSLMRNIRLESVAEHSHITAVLAHALACIEKHIFHENVNPELCVTYAIFHETAEVITGDLPTPIKYFNPTIKSAYAEVEAYAEKKILDCLPRELKNELTKVVKPPDSLEKRLVKYADKLAALIKCIEELAGNNEEFKDAYVKITDSLDALESRSVKYFTDNFLEPFFMSLDELSSD